MKTTFFFIISSFFTSTNTHATPMYSDEVPRFEKIVLSKNVLAECDAEKSDERGPFGVTYKDGTITHTFIVMTGVYYDTCKSLEKKINSLKRKESKIIIIGTEKNPQKDSQEIIWRWRAVKSLSGKECISYFENDCF